MAIFGKTSQKKEKEHSPKASSSNPTSSAPRPRVAMKEETGHGSSVLKKPHVSEKAHDISSAGNNHYFFDVDVRTTKPEVRRAVERQYGVHVRNVRIIRREGKRKQIGGRWEGRQSRTKKAIVSIKEGETIDLGQ